MLNQEQQNLRAPAGLHALPPLSELSLSNPRPVADDLNRIRDERERLGLPILNFNQGLIRPPAAWSDSIRSWFKEGLSSIEPWTMGRVAGREDLRSAIAEWRQPLWGCKISSANILVTLGANTAWNLVMRAVTNSGDSIAITKPYFFNHFGSINRSKRICQFLDMDFGAEVASLQRNSLRVLEETNVSLWHCVLP